MTTAGSRPLRIVTRGSALALAQTRWVAERLRPHLGDREIEIVPTTTRGDARRDVPLTELGEGVFVKALETELLEGRADLAVHSYKDVPSAETPGLAIGAVPTRADPHDAIITRNGQRLESLPRGAVVATGSPRRIAQLRALRSDLEFTGVRGNVDTRLRKLDGGEFDALVMAVAGLARLGLDHRISAAFAPQQCVPAAGQGALAVQCRADDKETLETVRDLNDPIARVETLAERTLLAAMGGGCRVPVGALGRITAEELELHGVIADPSGAAQARVLERGPSGDWAAIAQRAAELLRARAASFLAEAQASS